MEKSISLRRQKKEGEVQEQIRRKRTQMYKDKIELQSL
jgi:hypothetical protein